MYVKFPLRTEYVFDCSFTVVLLCCCNDYVIAGVMLLHWIQVVVTALARCVVVEAEGVIQLPFA